ncbi:hypothetical protein DCS_05798 [Drechmeria coniospora]|uniref:Hydrophobin n=1 Tax=Drechmeria coniospora TaxID=98403 RepID=A0A151GNW5_DRECN|nr:hypothetical protein DCS_05798 [Drechmeria coniospora]KYK58780.1 hypothetical protein DCS_05798 [Drechmeria coniospora]
MQFSIVTVLAAVAGIAMAAPGSAIEERASTVCSGALYTNAQCCTTVLLGIVGLGCDSAGAGAGDDVSTDERTVSGTPTDANDFQTKCGTKEAACCVLPVAGQNVLCKSPE